MPIFFTMYNMNWGNQLSASHRNCRIFVYGMCIYVLLYVLLKNIQISGHFGKRFDAFYTGLGILFFVDAVTMCYMYKSYYGRSILKELGNEEQILDPNTHTYKDVPLEKKLEEELHKRKLLEEYKIKEDLVSQKFAEINEQIQKEQQAEKQLQEILTNKNRNRAAIRIQRWWRKKLYNPDDGILYLRANKNFERLKFKNTKTN